MFGMGWNEIMVVMLLAVVVIGPRHLPEVAKGLGKMMAYFRRTSNDLRDAINSEIAEHDEAKELRDFTRTFDTEMHSIERTAKNYVEKEIEKEEKELKALADDVESSIKTATSDEVADLPVNSDASSTANGKAGNGNSGTGDTSDAEGDARAEAATAMPSEPVPSQPVPSQPPPSEINVVRPTPVQTGAAASAGGDGESIVGAEDAQSVEEKKASAS